MNAREKQAAVKEFDFKKGVLVATFSGIMSACFSFGLNAGQPIKALALKHGSPDLWQGLPVLVVVLLGGFTTNALWCLALNLRNRTGYQYFATTLRTPLPADAARLETAVDAPGEEMARALPPTHANGRIPTLANWAFSALAGLIWYFQFFFYSMGESQMGTYGFSSWTLHMASIIVFSTLWGIALHEWKGTGPRTRALIATGLTLLILATLIVGYGNYLGTTTPAERPSTTSP